jgi:outer membrane protein assembly factor BamE
MRKILLTIMITILLIGCSKLRPYRVDVQQGNVIDRKAMAQLHLGMSKSEVSSVLGTSLLDNTFNTNTWVYVYTNQLNGGKITKKKLILKFEADELVKINQ